MNYALSINGFEVINGYSDVLTPLLGGVRAAAGATGWWGNLRWFSLSRFLPEVEGGRSPVIRYLSNHLINRITFAERQACAEIAPEINNHLTHDEEYEGGHPERSNEVLQSWEALAVLNEELVTGDEEENLSLWTNKLELAKETYLKLSTRGITLDYRSNFDHIEPLVEGIEAFKKSAEI